MENTLHIIAHDVGTSSCKTCAFKLGEKLELLGSYVTGYPLLVPEKDHAEQEADDWWRAICDNTRYLLKHLDLPASLVKGVVFCCQMLGFVAVDREGQVLRRPMNFMDGRAIEQITKYLYGGLIKIEKWNAFKTLKTLAITGGLAGTAKDPLWKYHWVRDNEPDLFKRMYKWLDVKDYLVLRSTGNFITTPDSAHLTFLYDTRPGKPGWHKGLCKLFHVNPDHLPGVIEATDIAGDLAGQAAFEMGLEPGTPVIAGGGDASLIPVGAGCIEKYDTHIYLGTSGWVSTVLDRRKLDIKNFIASITGAIPHHYNYIAEQETAGICLEWVRDNLSLDETGLHPETAGIREPKQAIETLYRFLDQVVAETEPAAANVLFTPWLQGNRSPREDNNARGMFFNISLTTGKRQMIRSVLEGVAFHMRWMLEAVEKKVPRQDLIRFTGGGARSAQWAQILADITGRKIEIIENADYAGPTGAAIVSGIALGKLESVRAVKKLLSVTRTYHPRDKHKDIYDRNFAVFKDLYQMNKKLFKRLNAS